MNTTTDSVRIVLTNNDDPSRILVLSETDDPNNLKLPGGKFDSIDETPVRAAERELSEELGLDSSKIELTQVAELINDDGVSKRFIFCAVVNVASVSPSHEIHHIEWLTKDTIPAGKNQSHMLAAISAAELTTNA